jgi:hypothetical protein
MHKLFVIAPVNKPNLFVNIFYRKRSYLKGHSYTLYEVGPEAHLFTEYEKKKFFSIHSKQEFKVVQKF